MYALQFAISHCTETETLPVKQKVLDGICDYSGFAGSFKQEVDRPKDANSIDCLGTFQGFTVINFKIKDSLLTYSYNTGDDIVDLPYPPFALIYGVNGDVMSYHYIAMKEWAMADKLLRDKLPIEVKAAMVKDSGKEEEKKQAPKDEEEKSSKILPKTNLFQF